MQLIAELRAEHALIEQVLGSLRTYVLRRASGAPESSGDGDAFVRFFQCFSGTFHHGREEEVLLPALIADAELPPGSGPAVALVDQHHAMERMLEEMVPLLRREKTPSGGDERLVELATDYSRMLWRHIDAENSVLFPEGEQRLQRSGVGELPSRPMSGEEATARSEGERLVKVYPATYDPGAIRGEGCVICPSHGTLCEGVEREWWNDWEWEAFGRGQE